MRYEEETLLRIIKFIWPWNICCDSHLVAGCSSGWQLYLKIMNRPGHLCFSAVRGDCGSELFILAACSASQNLFIYFLFFEPQQSERNCSFRRKMFSVLSVLFCLAQKKNKIALCWVKFGSQHQTIILTISLENIIPIFIQWIVNLNILYTTSCSFSARLRWKAHCVLTIWHWKKSGAYVSKNCFWKVHTRCIAESPPTVPSMCVCCIEARRGVSLQLPSNTNWYCFHFAIMTVSHASKSKYRSFSQSSNI